MSKSKTMLSKLSAVKNLLVCWLTPFIWSPLLMMGKEAQCGYVVAVMITYWFTEVIPMAITSVIPVVLFPLLQIISTDEVAKSYFNGTVMVFLGSMIAASAVSKSNLHERIALKVIILTGTSPRRLFLGFMATTAFLSMWISNMATVAMMLPIANAALDQLTRRQSVSVMTTDAVLVNIGDRVRTNSIRTRSTIKTSTFSVLRKKQSKRLRKGILLGICYAANIGGTGTLTGTSTNLVLNEFLKDDPISFSDWFFFNVPGLVLLVMVTWFFLTCYFVRGNGKRGAKSKLESEHNEKQVMEALRQQYDRLGPIRFNEMAVLALFGLLFSLWFFRAPDFMYGWTTLFGDESHFIKDAVPTMFVVLLFFMIPADPSNLANSPMLLDWKSTREKVSWSVMLLMGGGFAMAKGCELSGLSVVVGNSLQVLQQFPPFVITLILCSVSMTLTELVSNAAAINIMLPVIQQMSQSMQMDMNPLSVMLPVTVSCSYAFMMPFSSGTNAIIFEAGKMKSRDMLIPGFFLKIMCVFILLAINNVWGPVIFELKTNALSNVNQTTAALD
ncbi:Na(+)/citrate cotransporter-like [Dermatophagoides pteronyssinus]|uniref:Na(+)/citrate cotransporter-like n=1 Tax=Dermatophagoides pteronyssinus TaxID=6956 RepID=UPI003F675EE4